MAEIPTPLIVLGIIVILVIGVVVGVVIKSSAEKNIITVDTTRFTVENIGVSADFLGNICDARLPTLFREGETVICDGRVRELNGAIATIGCRCISYSEAIRTP